MQRMQRKDLNIMYDQVTLGLNVDPFILSALRRTSQARAYPQTA